MNAHAPVGAATPPFRYRGLSYVALNVTDLDRSARYYEEQVGLTRASSDDGETMFRCSDTHHDLILTQGGEPGLKRVAFAMDSAADLAAAKAHLAACGHEPVDVGGNELGKLGVEAAFRVREPTSGLEFEFLHNMAAADAPFAATCTQIVRLGHVVIHVTDLRAVLAFLTEQANFRVSDYVEGRIAFLRAFPNPLHHCFAVQQAAENKLHHINFMVSDIDDVGKAMNRMKKAGSEIVFGPGRHEPSGSIFLYFLDPDGMTVEYSFGMEEFGEHDAREPRALDPRPDVLDTWGSVPAPDFAKVGAIEAVRG